jgi:glucose-6-phosphate 1-epimerase
MDIQETQFAGLPAVRLACSGGEHATVLRQGAQLVSWVDADGNELLYLSPLALLAPAPPLRGGTPVIFPQFGEIGPLAKHGFARTLPWELHDVWCKSGVPAVSLRLASNGTTHALWPHAFECYLQVMLDAAFLDISLTVHNPGTDPLRFNAALHSYFRLDRTGPVRLRGLPGFAEGPDLDGPFDLISRDFGDPLQLESALGRLELRSRGFTDTVVWNPGAVGKLADLPDGGYRDFVCIEPAAISRLVTVAAGASWTGSQLARWHAAHR